jgi:predicted nucleotidyltransferase
MNREAAIKILQGALPGLKERYSVKDLAIFGSVARNEATAESDVDILVEFEPGQAGGFFKFYSLQTELESALSQRVDLVTLDALKNQFREKILAEAIHAS